MSDIINQTDQSYEKLISGLEVSKDEKKPGQIIGKFFTYLALIAYSLFSLLPLWWTVTLAFKAETEIYTRTPKLFGFATTLDHWREVFSGDASIIGLDFLDAIKNSLIVVPAAVVLALILGGPVAYLLARYNFKGKEDVHFFYLSLYFMPPMLILIPLFVMYNKLGLYNTYFGMVLVLQLVTLPLVVLILRGFFEDIPIEIEHSARVDGAKPLWIFWRIILPLVRPGLVATAFLCTIFAWNNYIFSFLLTSGEKQSAVVRLTLYRTFTGFLWGPMSAAMLLTVLPVLILAIAIQKYIVRGLTLGAVKG
ncbi:MAG: carbohydrate ABC transporter permease [Chloroflexi bacterium]|jgi:multiple sugar transport system permease protein|nr:carbohydrate ABC transporter permease [Chloroflexota bacterium]